MGVIQDAIYSIILLSFLAGIYHFLVRPSLNIPVRKAFLWSSIIIVTGLFFAGLWTMPIESGSEALTSVSEIPETSTSLLWRHLIWGIYLLGATLLGFVAIARWFSFDKKNIKTGEKNENEYKLSTSQKRSITFLKYSEYSFAAIHPNREIGSLKTGRLKMFSPLLLDLLVAATWPIPLLLYIRNELILNHFHNIDAGQRLYGDQEQIHFAAALRDEGQSVALNRPLFIQERFKKIQSTPLFGRDVLLPFFAVIFALAAVIFMAQFTFSEKKTAVSSFAQEISDWSGKEMLILQKWLEPEPYMEWAGQKYPLTEIEKHTEIQFPIQTFNRLDFNRFQKELPVIYSGKGEPVRPKLARISITSNDHINTYNLECKDFPFHCIHEALADMSAQSSIQILFKTEDDEQLFCILSDKDETLYVPQFFFIKDPFIFEAPTTLRSYGVEKIAEYKVDYQFFWSSQLKLNLNDQNRTFVSPEQLKEAYKQLPGLAPIHGGMFEEFSFYLSKISPDGSMRVSSEVVVDESAPDKYFENLVLKNLLEDIQIGDKVRIDKVSFGDNKQAGSVTVDIVENPEFYQRPWKRNLAPFSRVPFNGEKVGSSYSKIESTFALKWGTYYIPIEFFATPDQFKAKIELSPEAFEDVIDYELIFHENDQPLHRDSFQRTLNINYVSRDGYDIQNVPVFRKQKDLKFDQSTANILKKSIHAGMTYRIHGRLGKIQINAIEIDIIDPDGPYSPPVNILARSQYVGEAFSFQLVQSSTGGKTIVKVDSLSPSASTIMNMYRDNSKYKIVHIPGFRTRKRLKSPVHIGGKLPRYLIQEPVDGTDLLEFSLDEKTVLNTKWGRMSSAPISGNYSVQEFSSSCRRPFHLYINNEEQKILQVNMRIYSGDNMTHHYVTKSVNDQVVGRALTNLQSKGSVYLTDILIDVEGVPTILPQDFVYVVE